MAAQPQRRIPATAATDTLYSATADGPPTMPRLPSMPSMPSLSRVHASLPSFPPQAAPPTPHLLTLPPFPIITGAALDVSADFAAYALSRRPAQLFSQAALAQLTAEELEAVRATLKRVYRPALALAGRLRPPTPTVE